MRQHKCQREHKIEKAEETSRAKSGSLQRAHATKMGWYVYVVTCMVVLESVTSLGGGGEGAKMLGK
jgi:hypothetical protein